jgi:hypothetical protein
VCGGARGGEREDRLAQDRRRDERAAVVGTGVLRETMRLVEGRDVVECDQPDEGEGVVRLHGNVILATRGGRHPGADPVGQRHEAAILRSHVS